MALDVNKTDLYALLGVSDEASEKELVKAYRKTALKCHPDKNPDNPNAADEFQKLSKAFEILTDVAARAAYDKSRKAKKAAEARHKVLDGKRKKFKEDLEAREQAAQDQRSDDLRAQTNLAAEIERLRKQGSSLLEQEKEYLKQQLKTEVGQVSPKPDVKAEDIVSPKLKITWSAKLSDKSNGGYSYGIMYGMFNKYGEVTALILSEKKNGRGIVEYKTARAATIAFQMETGLKDNPLTLKWLAGKPKEPMYPQVNLKSNESDSVHIDSSWNNEPDSLPAYVSFGASSTPYVKSNYVPITSSDRDFESLVLMKMRQAEERKRLIEQIQKEDEAS